MTTMGHILVSTAPRAALALALLLLSRL